MRLYSEIELNEQLDRLYLSPKQKSNIRGLISIITEKYSEQIEKMKCCFICKHKNDCVIEDYNNVCEKWEIKE